MEVASLLDRPCGVSSSVKIQIWDVQMSMVFGSQIPWNVPVAFRYKGTVTGPMATLLKVKRTNEMIGSSWILDLDDDFKPCFHRSPNKLDLSYAHDVCSGLGGFFFCFGISWCTDCFSSRQFVPCR